MIRRALALLALLLGASAARGQVIAELGDYISEINIPNSVTTSGLVSYSDTFNNGNALMSPCGSDGNPIQRPPCASDPFDWVQGTYPGNQQTGNDNLSGTRGGANFVVPSGGCFYGTALGKICITSTDGTILIQTNAGNNTAKITSGNSSSGTMLSFGGNGLLTVVTGNGGANGTLASGGFRFVQPAAQTTGFTFTATQSLVRCDATSGSVTGTLPSAAANGQHYIFVKADSSANTCVMTRGSTNTVDGVTSVTLNNQGDWIEVVDGTSTGNWTIVGGNYSYKTCQTQLSVNGASFAQCQISELLTLSTGGATTDTTANLLPANSIIDAVVARVTVTTSGGITWSLGDATTAARFIAAGTSGTAGTTAVGILQWSGAVTTLAAGPSQASAAKVRVTASGTPSTGQIRLTSFVRTATAPAS